jgi:hypothetical protein
MVSRKNLCNRVVIKTQPVLKEKNKIEGHKNGYREGIRRKNNFSNRWSRVHRNESMQEVSGIECRESDNIGRFIKCIRVESFVRLLPAVFAFILTHMAIHRLSFVNGNCSIKIKTKKQRLFFPTQTFRKSLIKNFSFTKKPLLKKQKEERSAVQR